MVIKLPQFVSIAKDGVPEFFLDHTLLSSLRMCESRFQLDHIDLYSGRGLTPWPLAFCSLFHSSIEWYYKSLMTNTFELSSWLAFTMNLWREGNFDAYAQHPQFKAVGGREGLIALLVQYKTFYDSRGDNLKPVALEVAFGKNKEVPLLENAGLYSYAPFRLYLAGRMDFIFDNGRNLGPLDHKTFSMSGHNPMTTYEVQEGMTGYIYAMTHLYKMLKAKHELENPGQSYDRSTNVLWLNFILTKADADMSKRFQRMPLYKTNEQLEDWRLRQISSCAKLYQMLFQNRPADFNASVCTNYWHSTCPYQAVHRLPSKADQQIILSKTFDQGRVWNPEALENV